MRGEPLGPLQQIDVGEDEVLLQQVLRAARLRPGQQRRARERLTADAVRFSSSPALLILPSRATTSNAKIPFSGGKFMG